MIRGASQTHPVNIRDRSPRRLGTVAILSVDSVEPATRKGGSMTTEEFTQIDENQSILRLGLALVRRQVRAHPGPFAASVVGAAMFALFTVLNTVVLGRVVDDVVAPTFDEGFDGGLARRAVIAVVIVAILRVVGVVLRRYFAGMTSERVTRANRHKLTDQYLGQPLEWHQTRPTGQLLAHAEGDTEVAAEVLHPLPFSLGVAFLALFAAVSLLLADPLLAVVALAIFPTLIVFNRFYSDRVKHPAARVQHSLGVASSIAHESFDGALVVKTLGREAEEVDRFESAVDDLRANRVEVGFTRAAFEPVLDALPNIGIVVVLVVGVYRIDAGALRPGELVQIAALFSVLAFPMRVLGFFLEMMPPSVVAQARLDGIYEADIPEPPASPRTLQPGPVEVEAAGLGVAYGSKVVLENVSFTVRPGEVVAVVGSTAAGKSSLVQVLAGLVAPTAGSVQIGGIDVVQLDQGDRTRGIGLVFQESFLFADSIRANIDVTGEAEHAEVVAAAQIASADEFVSALDHGYDTVVGERGVTLSGGQRQRVALARALVRHPQLLLLDDATSAVDAAIEQAILASLRSSLAMTTVIVAQRLSTIELADRVIYLANGTTAGIGTHAELLSIPSYESLVSAYEEAAS